MIGNMCRLSFFLMFTDSLLKISEMESRGRWNAMSRLRKEEL